MHKRNSLMPKVKTKIISFTYGKNVATISDHFFKASNFKLIVKLLLLFFLALTIKE